MGPSNPRAGPAKPSTRPHSVHAPPAGVQTRGSWRVSDVQPRRPSEETPGHGPARLGPGPMSPAKPSTSPHSVHAPPADARNRASWRVPGRTRAIWQEGRLLFQVLPAIKAHSANSSRPCQKRVNMPQKRLCDCAGWQEGSSLPIQRARQLYSGRVVGAFPPPMTNRMRSSRRSAVTISSNRGVCMPSATYTM